MPTSYTVTGNTVTAATFPNLGSAGQQGTIRDRRPDLSSGRLRGDRRSTTSTPSTAPATGCTSPARSATPTGTGKTPKQDVFEGDVFNTGATLQMHGIGVARSTSPSRAAIPSNFAGTSLDWIFGASPASTEDKETYGQIDGTYLLDLGRRGRA